MRKQVTIRAFRDLPEALLAKGSLESAGIDCFLVDDNMVRLDWFMVEFYRRREAAGRCGGRSCG